MRRLTTPILLAAWSLGHGGGERQMATVALNLDRRRFKPYVLSMEGGFWEPALQEAGVPLRRLPVSSFASLRAASEAWRLRRWIRERGIRLVLTFDFTMNIFAVPVALTIPGVVALSNQRCDLSLIPNRYRSATRWVHRAATGVIVNSPHLTTELSEQWAIRADRIHVCPNGLDTMRFHSRGRTRRAEVAGARLVVGTASVLRPEKNIDLLIRAFAAAAHAEDRLLIVGSGPEEAPLKGLARDQGIFDRCHFVPSTNQVEPWLRSMDVFVLASHSEGQSNALMEAMACGCGVTAADIGGNRGLIRPGQNGLLFVCGDPNSLSNRLTELLGQATVRQALARQAEQDMRNNYSVPKSIEWLERTFSNLLQSGRR